MAKEQKERKKKKKLNSIVKFIVNTALRLVDNLLVNRIQQEEIKQLTLMATDRVRQTVQALADDNTEDNKQVAQVWLGFARDVKFRRNLQKLIADQVVKIENVGLRKFLLSVLNPFFDTIGALIDDVDADGEQIGNIWKQYFMNVQNIEHLFLLFDPKGKHTGELEFAAQTVGNLLRDILNELD